MKKILIDEAEDNYIYSIEEYHGEKFIHLWGYIYNTGCSITENTEQEYRSVEFCGFSLDINKFIKLKENEDFRDDIFNMASEMKQYIGDLTKEEAQRAFDNYFGDTVFPVDKPHAPTPLLLSKVTMDTPCGDYIDL